MKKFVGEALGAVFVILPGAAGKQLVSLLSMGIDEPLDQACIAAASICTVVYRNVGDQESRNHRRPTLRCLVLRAKE